MYKKYTWVQPIVAEENGQKYYQTLEITAGSAPGQRYQVGDTVLFHGDSDPYIGEIHSMYEKKSGQKFVHCQWFYRPDDVRTLAKQERKQENIDILKGIDLSGPVVFSSTHNDETEVETILRPCSVEYMTVGGDKFDQKGAVSHGNDAFVCRHHFRTEKDDFSIIPLTCDDLNRHSSLFRPYFHLPPRRSTGQSPGSERGDGAAGGAAASKKARIRASKDGDDGANEAGEEDVTSLVGRISKDRARRLFDRPTESRNAAETVLVTAFRKMVEKVTLSVGALVAQMDKQQVHELMLEAWDGLDVASRTEYLTEAAAAAMVSNKKKTNQSQQLQQNNRSSGAAAVSTSSMSGQKRKAALAMSCSSSSSTGEYDHDDYGGGDGSGGGSGRAIASIASPMSRFSTRGASALTSPSYQQQQSFLRSPSSSDRHDHTRLNVPTGGYQPPRVGDQYQATDIPPCSSASPLPLAQRAPQEQAIIEEDGLVWRPGGLLKGTAIVDSSSDEGMEGMDEGMTEDEEEEEEGVAAARTARQQARQEAALQRFFVAATGCLLQHKKRRCRRKQRPLGPGQEAGQGQGQGQGVLIDGSMLMVESCTYETIMQVLHDCQYHTKEALSEIASEPFGDRILVHWSLAEQEAMANAFARYGDDLRRLQLELQGTKSKAQVADYYFHHIYPPTQLDSNEVTDAPSRPLVAASAAAGASRRLRDIAGTATGGGSGVVEEKEEDGEEEDGWDEAQLDEAFDRWDTSHSTTSGEEGTSNRPAVNDTTQRASDFITRCREVMNDETFAELTGALVSFHRQITTPRVLVSHVRALINQAAAALVAQSSSSSSASSSSSSSSSSLQATTTTTTTTTTGDDSNDVAPPSSDTSHAIARLSAELLETFAAFLPPNLRPLVTSNETAPSTTATAAAASTSMSSAALGGREQGGQGLAGGAGGD